MAKIAATECPHLIRIGQKELFWSSFQTRSSQLSNFMIVSQTPSILTMLSNNYWLAHGDWEIIALSTKINDTAVPDLKLFTSSLIYILSFSCADK